MQPYVACSYLANTGYFLQMGTLKVGRKKAAPISLYLLKWNPMNTVSNKNIVKTVLGMVAHIFNPRAWEVEAGESLCSRPA